MTVGRVLLYSGGLDSYITARRFPDARLLYVDTKSAYSDKEQRFLHRTAPRLVTYDKRLDLSDVEREDAIVPARNLLLATIASYYGNEIFLAATSGDRSTDKDDAFAERASQLLSHIYSGSHFPSHPPIRIILPFKDSSKAQMVHWYLKQGFDSSVLSQLISCYSANELHCGQCKPCIRKWVALACHGIDQTPWSKHPTLYDWMPIVAKINSGGWRGGREDAETLMVLRKHGVI